MNQVLIALTAVHRAGEQQCGNSGVIHDSDPVRVQRRLPARSSELVAHLSDGRRCCCCRGASGRL